MKRRLGKALPHLFYTSRKVDSPIVGKKAVVVAQVLSHSSRKDHRVESAAVEFQFYCTANKIICPVKSFCKKN